MKINAIIPETKDNQQRYLLEATAEELDAIRGVSGKSQVANRYKVGYEMQPHTLFQRVSNLMRKLDRLKQIPQEIGRANEAVKQMVDALEEAQK